jgi:nickel transport system ATP-binding protein
MLLRVKDLSVTHHQGKKATPLTHQVSFHLNRNRCLGIVGESGSGKSITCSAIAGLLNEHFTVSGAVEFKGRQLPGMTTRERRKLRGRSICMILQSPMTAFNPLFTIGNQLVETLTAHLDISAADVLEIMKDALERVNLKDPTSLFGKYPHEMSGGMLQRVMTALALVMKPELIIADEPTTAIDYVSQQDVIHELKAIRDAHQTALIFISHDLSLVSHVADDVIVMREGCVVESGPTDKVFFEPQHEYTRELIENRENVIRVFVELMGGGLRAA